MSDPPKKKVRIDHFFTKSSQPGRTGTSTPASKSTCDLAATADESHDSKTGDTCGASSAAALCGASPSNMDHHDSETSDCELPESSTAAAAPESTLLKHVDVGYLLSAGREKLHEQLLYALKNRFIPSREDTVFSPREAGQDGEALSRYEILS